MDTFNLEFDDAYQYMAAEKHAAILVSFDEDFNRTKRGAMKPTEVLQAK
jgi:predicted nucleic acid-binding protein